MLEQRRRIAKAIQRAPSLRGCPQEVFDDCDLSGRLDAAAETGMDFTLFPADAPFTLGDALDQGFLSSEPDREARE